ncbi:hypothetical protein P9112_004105 [Eukaryota sp. TZLM1-RC]
MSVPSELNDTTLLGSIEEFNDSHRNTLITQKEQTYGPLPERLQRSSIANTITTLDNQTATTQLSFSTFTGTNNTASKAHSLPDLATTIKTIKDNIENAHDAEEAFLSTLDPSERTRLLREQRALDHYHKTQRIWDKFKIHLASKLKVPTDQLVISRSDAFRERTEQRAIFSRAQPRSHYDESSWQASLRGGGTNFVPISSNPFSCLYCPIVQQTKPKPIEMVRRPGKKVKKEKKSFDQSDYAQTRRIELKSRIRSVVPHEPDFDSLVLSGEGLLTEEKITREFDLFLLNLQNEDLSDDEEVKNSKTQEKSFNVHSIQTQVEKTLKNNQSFTPVNSSKPVIDLSRDHISTFLYSGAPGLNRRVESIIITNNSAESVNVLLTQAEPNANVLCFNSNSVLLPNENVKVDFIIKGDFYGIFNSEWKISVLPALQEEMIVEINWAVGAFQDSSSTKLIRQLIEGRKEKQFIQEIVESLINDLPIKVECNQPQGLTIEDNTELVSENIDDLWKADDLFIDQLKNKIVN